MHVNKENNQTIAKVLTIFLQSCFNISVWFFFFGNAKKNNVKDSSWQPAFTKFICLFFASRTKKNGENMRKRSSNVSTEKQFKALNIEK